INVTINLDFIDFSAIPSDETVSATITYGYIEDERLRIDTYRRIAEATTPQAVKDLYDEITDRFGKPPQSVTRLFKLTDLRILATNRGILSVETQGSKLMLRSREKFLMENSRFPRLQASTPDDKLKEISVRIQTVSEWSLKSS
ncbi:MAG: hypothetical protein KAI74_02120, partial [Kiritimatiellae bacterium]|nr:hypothetical protein [Kiritimatiellia bacterium]